MSSGMPEQPVPATMVRPPYAAMPAPAPRRRSAVGIVLMLVLVAMLGGSILLNFVLLVVNVGAAGTEIPVREKHHSLNKHGGDKVAIISVEGVMLETEDGFVKRQIDRVIEDKSVKAVVLRVDTPGGAVTAADYDYHHLRKMLDKKKIPMVVSMGSVAASGGYYVAMAAGDGPDTIFAEPTTWTGSIGVIIPHYDASEGLAKIGVKEDAVASHRLKGMGSFARPMTEEEEQIWQQLVDLSFERFKSIIRESRPRFKKDPEALDKVATGQVYAAQQALDNGLIDKIGFVEDAIDRAIELAQLDRDEVNVVKYEQELSLSDLLMGASARTPSLDLSMLADLTTPRAYYWWSTLPPLTANRGYRGMQ